MDAGSTWTRTGSGTSLSEMVTPRLETMAENSRFKKKVHFGGTVRAPDPAPGGRARVFVLDPLGLALGEMGWLAVEGMALHWVCLRITVFLVVVFRQGRLLFPYRLSTAPKIEEKNQGSRQVTQADLSTSDAVMSQGPSRFSRVLLCHGVGGLGKVQGVETNWSIYS